MYAVDDIPSALWELSIHHRSKLHIRKPRYESSWSSETLPSEKISVHAVEFAMAAGETIKYGEEQGYFTEFITKGDLGECEASLIQCFEGEWRSEVKKQEDAYQGSESQAIEKAAFESVLCQASFSK